ncbi:beta-ketoacyl-ACP synthase II [Candidatus Viridilinea mediisalina]|uniref:3-oxoacyl-[acyl-carrier-protein] synthase 2 n=1 Tax=Candidatus Viridilinea mediisalina TaxID=2024553 RepID=A0A2A6RG36_9CHLR|nr:beta-ketoacyl-ACP synthase II [Candidatus Viridilinea mediisalina]PDW01982.1 beta-ketoacyl-[acyl-carrier-protein] synthase II [Candidatus Viridilinea mediisalina]
MERRVVVTGMGAVTPLGLSVPELWAGVLAARSGVGPITLFDASDHATRFAAEVKGFDPTQVMDRKEARRTDRFVQLAVAAATEALHHAGLEINTQNRDEVGVFIASGIGGIATLSEQLEILHSRGPGRISPFLIPAMITNLAAGQVSITTGARGPSFCITSACASSAHAIGEAVETIRRGWARVIIAGGSEASITPIGIAGFQAMRALSTRNEAPEQASRPFDAARDGFVMGEGAGALILEDLEFALARGAPILAEVLGYAATSDAYHISNLAEDGEGIARAIRLALRRAGLTHGQVSYINAHATGTPSGDPVESAAIKEVFGPRGSAPPVSASKSQFGHLLGAAGAVEAVISILAIQHGQLPPTINLAEPDPACDLDYVPNAPRPAQVDVVLNNSFGFGGHNVCLLFRRYDPPVL